MSETSDVPQGTLALPARKSIDLPGLLDGYRMARRILARFFEVKAVDVA